MDKSKELIANWQKYGFWILCGLVVVLATGTWYVSTKSLRVAREARVKKIEGVYRNIRTASRAGIPLSDNLTVQPNNDTLNITKDVHRQNKESVYQAWDAQYKFQGEKVFVWPSKLQQGFRDQVAKMRPIESTVKFPTPDEEELSVDYLTDYRDYIQEELPKLADIIGAKWNTQADRNSGNKPVGGDAFGSDNNSQAGDNQSAKSKEPPPIVDWNSTNQNSLASRFSWPGQGGRDGVPTTLQVLYAQEDLWVLTALMNIIKTTNLISGKDPDEQRKAVIKKIEFLQIGNAATGKAGSILKLSGGGPIAGQNGGVDGGGQPGLPGGPEPGGAPGGEVQPGGNIDPGGPGGLDDSGVPGEPGSGNNNLDPAGGRYVDKDYKPLPASALRKPQGSSDDASQEDILKTVAKRMPVRLKLVMDQRKISNLLTACANSPLTVEVRQVRIMALNGKGNSNQNKAAGGGNNNDGQFPPGGGNFGQSGEFGGAVAPGSGGEGASGQDGPGGAAESSLTPYDRTIEVYGIIYIYNPPPKLPASQGDNAGQQAGNTAPATVPAGG